MCLDLKKDGEQEGDPVTEAFAYAEWWEKMTPEQKLWAEAGL